ncbi:MAG TPA: hypothetical protein DCM45_01235 [Clostridiales bacterium]|nr:hypothetical protein [Clostridiales bacterium]
MKSVMPQQVINKEITRGAVVRSMAGHDRGELFIVLQVADGFAWLADGKSRRQGHPKKKRVLHVRTVSRLPDIAALDALEQLGDPGQRDAALRTLLRPFTLTIPEEEET